MSARARGRPDANASVRNIPNADKQQCPDTLRRAVRAEVTLIGGVVLKLGAALLLLEGLGWAAVASHAAWSAAAAMAAGLPQVNAPSPREPTQDLRVPLRML